MFIKNLLHWYQYDMNYQLYWWLRLSVPQMGGKTHDHNALST
mgnify:CR=1 FL=1